MAQALLGNEVPRVFTKPLRELTPETTKGYEFSDFARAIGIPLLPWQDWLAKHMLELRPDGSFRFRTVVLLVARQNGKSTFLQLLALYFMYIREVPLVLSTAQNLDVAKEIWEDGVKMALSDPDLAAAWSRTYKTNGNMFMEFHSGSRWKVQAANSRGGRGLSGDLVCLDELREHKTWEAWSAISKTTMARANSIVFALSNAGDLGAVVLRHLRMQAHRALGDPDKLWVDPSTGEPITEDLEDLSEEDRVPDDTLGLFEWSAKPGRSKFDREGWKEANPSMGYTDLVEANIRSAAHSDPEWEFRTEVLCQWFDGSVEGPFPSGTWDGSKDPHSKLAADTRVVYGVDTAWDRTITRIALAGYREDGSIHFEVVAARPGTEWVIPWLKDDARKFKPAAVSWQLAGAPVSSLTRALEESELPLAPWGGTELGRGTGQFYDLITHMMDDEKTGEQTHAPKAWHRPQPALDVAANTAIPKTAGDSWFWDRSKSPADISPLVAATAAVFGLLNHNPVESKSAYEDADEELDIML